MDEAMNDQVWNLAYAESSMERWIDLCERETWIMDDPTMELINRVFGSSWYFTRFIFYHGKSALNHLNFDSTIIKQDVLREQLAYQSGSDIETELEQLRVKKNELMLLIFTGFLTEQINQRETEAALTHLAENTLASALNIVFTDKDYKQHFAVLGMGRMAGDEMTFGSDLDLIFLYTGNSEELFTDLSRQIRRFLREIAAISPAGVMYEVDTRLRPHGNSGVLITSIDSFLQYHASDEREIWERQMMTRCRPVYDPSALLDEVFVETQSNIYRKYEHEVLRDQIRDMRQRVEVKLGTPRDKFDIKRGHGGIMDIDFISHYFQLKHGFENSLLRETSTRNALKVIRDSCLIDGEQYDVLISGYDYLKRLEACLRVFDMKSIDTISKQQEANHVIARAMGHGLSGNEADTKAFMQEYGEKTQGTREIFSKIF